jgi:hypothetical protein
MDGADGDSTDLDNFNPIVGLKDCPDMSFEDAIAILLPALSMNAGDMRVYTYAAKRKASPYQISIYRNN